ncbi:MAG TPA: phosphohistidine phosphatase [Acidimicrobiaceae bacterium]|nr:phosphohistidine phosphatase [Acidimicrobiaceae bacterium]
MRTLWILRHAKAVPHSPRDHGRRLAARGRRQCEELSARLPDMKGTPTLVLSSSATRALETAEGVLPGLGPGAEVVVEPGLYQADPDDVIELVRQVDDTRAEVMVVGHNPTLYELVLFLLGSDDARGRKKVERGLGTAALAVVSFEVDHWAQVAPGDGHLEELVVPKAR